MITDKDAKEFHKLIKKLEEQKKKKRYTVKKKMKS